ncbi:MULTISPECIES: TonB-dependent siderophore receptor [unclassified Modicisalibacter]|uniref:TonB-dependent receptor n=1 Tax=unclassified Modicisalibacter TaxID=2679913 RepID=UPI001CC9AB5A|nr:MULTISPECIES: TonB-dependent siderophore receptor [unclassified Modicisalibacter]MBZ9559761.1 TonB-dependent siderophore receptor [Modicisalibacter sp. R2A 31.J]MBZ9577213.1 TonB-dependent siderophore receptor [Modicisalibacter sp. MOD 31.J]
MTKLFYNDHVAHFLPKPVHPHRLFPLGCRVAVMQKTLLLGLAIGTLTASPWVGAQTVDTQTDVNDKRTAPQAPEDLMILPSVQVIGDAAEPTVPYAGGQVATGGRMGFLGDRDFMETPFSTISYTKKFIEDQQATDIQEVISKTDPAVFRSGIPGESNESYSIRGLPSSVGDVIVNGLAGMAGYYRSSPEMFERVEVLKGPSALLNGMPPKGSAGGAVNLVTKRAGDEPLTRLTTSYMSEAHVGGHIDIGRRFGENQQFGVRFNGTYRDGETALEEQDKTAKQLALGLDWRGERARISADLYQSQDRIYGVTRGFTLAPGLSLPRVPSSDVAFNPPWSFYDTQDKGAMINGEFDLSNQLTAYALAGISKTEFDSIMGAPQITNEAGDFAINYSGVSDEMERKSAEIGLKGTLETGSIGHQFAVNATSYNEDYHLNGFINLLPQEWVSNIYNPVWGPEPERPSPVPAITRTETRLTSFGFADTLSFLDDKVHLTLGARRQEVVDESFLAATGARIGQRYEESATTPAAAILVEVTDQVSVYANYIEGLSQGEAAPNTAENAGEIFAPYKTKQKEVGLKFDLGDFAHTLSVYEIKRPSSYTDPATNVFSFGGEQRNRGVEWGFFGSPLSDVRLMGGVAYLDAEVTKATDTRNEGKQATGVPQWQAKLGAEWDLPTTQGLTLTANATSVSKQYLNADNSLSVPGHTVFDAGARYTTSMSGHPLTLRATVTNVTNKSYWAKPHFTTLALGAPRTVMLSASLDL